MPSLRDAGARAFNVTRTRSPSLSLTCALFRVSASCSRRVVLKTGWREIPTPTTLEHWKYLETSWFSQSGQDVLASRAQRPRVLRSLLQSQEQPPQTILSPHMSVGVEEPCSKAVSSLVLCRCDRIPVWVIDKEPGCGNQEVPDPGAASHEGLGRRARERKGNGSHPFIRSSLFK